MPIEQQVVQVLTKDNSSRHRPKVIKWKGVSMIRNHSFLATISEIVKVAEGVEGFAANKGSDAIRIGLVGDTHTGKTTMAEALAHAIHKKSKLPWIVKRFSKEQLVEFKKTLLELTPTNHILIFDDVSFLASLYGKHKIDLLQQAATEIRHFDESRDVKIIAIYNYHYTKALPPYLRQADYKYYTSVGSSETKNLEEMLGSKKGNKMSVVTRFQEQFFKARTKGFYRFNIGPKEFLKLNYRDPFILALFWDNLSLRPIISPTREWMDEICAICTGGKDTVTDKEFIAECEAKFDPFTFKTAIKQELLLEGVSTYNKKLTQCSRFVQRAKDSKLINIRDIAAQLGIKVTNTRLDIKLDI